MRLLGRRWRLLWTTLHGLSSTGFRPGTCRWRHFVVAFGRIFALVSCFTPAPFVDCPPSSIFGGFYPGVVLYLCDLLPLRCSCSGRPPFVCFRLVLSLGLRFPALGAPVVAGPPPSRLAPVSRLTCGSSGCSRAPVCGGIPWSSFTDFVAPRVVCRHWTPLNCCFCCRCRAPRVSCTLADGHAWSVFRAFGSGVLL